MIFDVHCHILPGVDDGAKDGQHTKRMLEIASAEGIDVIVATPHFAYGRDKKEVEEIKRKYEEVRKQWRKRGSEKELYLGNELFYSEGVVDAISEGTAMTMNGTRYVLVEFPLGVGFSYIQKAIQKLQYAGYFPIIAHVERYGALKKRKLIQELVDMGAYVQVNVSAVLGKHGFMVKRYVMQLIKRDLVHFIGTDAHDTRERKPQMKRCMQHLQKKLGVKKMHRILEENPSRMLKGEGLNG